MQIAAVLVVAAAGLARGEGSSSADRGAEAYRTICRYCHDTGVAPSLRGRQLSAEYLGVFVRNGMRAMPAFRTSEVDDETLADLAAYLAKD